MCYWIKTKPFFYRTFVVHELRITNQVIYLNPPIEECRYKLYQEMFAWKMTVLSLPRIQSQRYQVSTGPLTRSYLGLWCTSQDASFISPVRVFALEGSLAACPKGKLGICSLPHLSKSFLHQLLWFSNRVSLCSLCFLGTPHVDQVCLRLRDSLASAFWALVLKALATVLGLWTLIISVPTPLLCCLIFGYKVSLCGPTWPPTSASWTLA